MSGQKTFKGYAITDPQRWSDFELVEFPSKTFEETDVEVRITHCGVCGTDVHTISGGWGEIEMPMIVGHEIVGEVVRVGKDVKDPEIQVGRRVGIGAQVASCYDCKHCKNDNENYCMNLVHTYNDKLPTGERTQGGYSNGIIAHEQYVFPIPDGLDSRDACSMLCGGLTVYSPLFRNGIGPGKKVGIVGIGGLGHYAILFAKAMGAEVYAFSHSASKEADIRNMGADHVIFTSDPDFHKPHKMGFDLILSTRDESKNFPLEEFITMLDVNGKFITVGIPNEPIPGIPAIVYALNGSYFGGSHLGSKKEAVEMLKLAAESHLKPWIQVLPMSEAKQAVEGVWKGKARYRYVLEQDIP